MGAGVHLEPGYSLAPNVMALVRLFSPDTEPELITVVAMLEAHAIPCFVHNAGFGGLYPGPQIDVYNARAIMVAEEDVPAAVELINGFRAQPSEPTVLPTAPSRLRAIIETLLFGWFIPGHRHRKRRD